MYRRRGGRGFPRDQMPKIYDALKLEGSALTLEVQQQLGDGVVRTIALGSSDGLRHWHHGVQHGKPHHGACRQRPRWARIMDVLGTHRRAWSGQDLTAVPSTARPCLRRAVAIARTAGNRHQGD